MSKQTDRERRAQQRRDMWKLGAVTVVLGNLSWGLIALAAGRTEYSVADIVFGTAWGVLMMKGAEALERIRG